MHAVRMIAFQTFELARQHSFMSSQAVEVFERMQACEAGDPKCIAKPDSYTYSCIITACRQSGQWQKAMEIYEVSLCSYAVPASQYPEVSVQLHSILHIRVRP